MIRSPFRNITTKESAVDNAIFAAASVRVSQKRRPLATRAYNPSMPIVEQITKDMTAAMKAREELRLGTLRMVKTALKNKEIDKSAALDDKEALAVLSTLVKQRKDSIEQFTKGNRPELAEKEAAEIAIIESYMPKAVGEEEIAATVRATIAQMGSPTIKDMGTVMKNVMAKFAAQGSRVDGTVVSATDKRELTPKT